ncbi:zinc finger protein [Reticulomyxa filosa]|uniref:Zinc finger protein n=1 Tax=Reticulomyxa filosa TaxID=46433 RepID=X6M112_RETFI|nr:zinc finger protein [Reticulomyxa filosa]|eukprot:ETO07559.1 zinc finger protein [Reticulomyxa filosa]
MGNQTTHFQTLKDLPTPLEQSQCVLHKHELLICGCYQQRACYSYHTLKNEYKFICEYPGDVQLKGHCVVKLVDSNSNNDKDNNQITLLSIGGSPYTKRHTLVMKYVSVWSDDNNNDDENENEMNKSKKFNQFNQFNKSNNYNQWVPFTDNRNHPIIIGRERDDDNYQGARALVGGINNHLLFITYHYNNISVFDLNTFQFIKHDILPTNFWIQYHCFVSKSEMMKTNQQNYQMLLFCFETGLSIEYDEDNNTFQFQKLSVCKDIAPLFSYAYVCINDVILFFGGLNNSKWAVSKSMHKYSIRENKWMTFQSTLPIPLFDCVAILSEDNTNVHIIGGANDKFESMSTHMKTEVSEWLSEEEMKKVIELKVEEEKEKKKKKKKKKEMETMKKDNNVEHYFITGK